MWNFKTRRVVKPTPTPASSQQGTAPRHGTTAPPTLRPRPHGLAPSPLTESDGVNLIPYIKLWGWSKNIFIPKHNLLQQFPYSPSQLLGPTSHVIFSSPRPNLRSFPCRPPLPSRGRAPSRARSCLPRPPPPPANKPATSTSATRSAARRASPSPALAQPSRPRAVLR
jgi:hypothetical protein